MLVKAVRSFGGSKYGHKAEGSVFELPDGVDWLQAGLVIPFVEEPEEATIEAPERAVTRKRVTRRKTK